MPRKLALWGCFGALAMVRLLYILSFPLNFGGDASIYYTMIVEKHSSLLMAGGYPFLVMLPFHGMRWLVSQFVQIPEDPMFSFWWQSSTLRGDVMELLPAGSDFSWVALFQNHDLILLQHAVAFLALICGFLLVRKHFGVSRALLFAFLYGMSPLSLEWPSCSLPEWMQGSFLIFWLCLADKAKEAHSSKKLFLYAALGVVGALAQLVKFNSLPVFVVLFGGLLIWERETLRKSVTKTAVALIAVACTIAVFQVTYHIPTTGTWNLTLNSWPLGDKVFLYLPDRTLSPELGIHSSRLLALHKNLPHREKVYSPAPYFRHVDANSAERAAYRERFLWMMKANQKELDRYLNNGTFEPIHLHDPILKVAYFIGLPEYTSLLRGMYLEVLKKHPFLFLQSTTNAFFQNFSMKETSYFFHPLWDEVQVGRADSSYYGFIKFLWPTERHVCYHENVVWLPGVWLFTQLESLWPPTWVLWLMAFVSFVVACNGLSQNRHLVVFLFLVLLMFVFFSNAIWIFRLKEFELIRSLVTALAASGIYQTFWIIRRAERKIVYRWKQVRYSI